MNWLDFFFGLWALILMLVAIFVGIDAKNAFDRDPYTPTLSSFIKRWRQQRAYRGPLLGAGIGALVLVPVYLFAHLVLELV